ncbi:hypothetical protein KRX52_10855 [Pseudomonas sp. MAP12]|uniref:Uncharacterized protein n=1 Tax=Geopseudomonas aromaticivorans TaxID=2849492 RepID=A0ABS6MY39_9GAMM|nr:hypothetical protein [Pseudomonas aromaticivorans]MBV2133294.1 hypothetical protein [Pseudomonas aromaticivorans]
MALLISSKPAPHHPSGDSKPARVHVPRVNNGGNYCGHNPAGPALDIVRPETSRRRPKILDALHANVGRFYSNPGLLPNVRWCSISRDGCRHDRRRSMRSERREAIIQILRAAVHFVDIVTLHLGRPIPAGFAWVTKAKMRQLTSLSEKRFDRALRDLRESRIVRIYERNKPVPFVEGEFRAEPAIKIFSKHLFGAFGLSQWLQKEQEKAAQRRQAQKAQQQEGQKQKPSGAARARTGLVLDGLVAKIGRISSRKSVTKKISIEQRSEILRERGLAIFEMKLANPDADAATISREVDRTFKTRGIDIDEIQRLTFKD